MSTTRFLLMLTSFLVLVAVLVFYIASSKRKPKASKMDEIFSRFEDIGFHSMEIPPAPRSKQTNGELYRKQGWIKYKLILSRYLRVMQVRLDCLKEEAVWIEVKVQALPCYTAQLNPP